jgi:hypothetical protein
MILDLFLARGDPLVLSSGAGGAGLEFRFGTPKGKQNCALISNHAGHAFRCPRTRITPFALRGASSVQVLNEYT